MLSYIGKLFYLITPIILAGIFNMIFVKLPFLNSLKKPIDCGKVFSDGERIFGDNKTWKGFCGMIIITSFWLGMQGILYDNTTWAKDISLVSFSYFNFPFNTWFYGAIWGLGYVLFELPNSFVKRRLKIDIGKSGKGTLGYIFKFVDQADSVVGCIIFMLPFYRPSFIEALLILVLGIAVN